MVKVSKNVFKVTKGDTVDVPLHLTFNGEPYVPSEGDVIRFALKRDIDDAEPVMIKVIPNDTLRLYISAEECDELEPAEKKPYCYDVQLTLGHNGHVITFITYKEGKFYVEKEVE